MKKKTLILCLSAVLCAAVVCAALLCVKFIRHEKWQNEQILQLRAELDALYCDDDDYEPDEPEMYADTAFSYLAIGNSITLHSICDYWWNEIGMAASLPERDYFHLVTATLEELYGDVVSYPVNLSVWEMQSTDRAETLTLLDPYLSPRLDLVTIQLSENLSDLTAFDGDFAELINYVKAGCPNAKIIIVDDFWNDTKSELKRAAAEECGAAFADLSEIRWVDEYQCGMDTVVYGEDGAAHIVDSSGVAIHPGDAGMAYIAEAIIRAMQFGTP